MIVEAREVRSVKQPAGETSGCLDTRQKSVKRFNLETALGRSTESLIPSIGLHRTLQVGTYVPSCAIVSGHECTGRGDVYLYTYQVHRNDRVSSECCVILTDGIAEDSIPWSQDMSSRVGLPHGAFGGIAA